jgi:hypothetical protein
MLLSSCPKCVKSENQKVSDKCVFFLKNPVFQETFCKRGKSRRGVHCTHVSKELAAAFIESLVIAPLRQSELFYYSLTAVSSILDVIIFSGFRDYAALLSGRKTMARSTSQK